MNKNLVCIVGVLGVFCSQQLYGTVVWNTGNPVRTVKILQYGHAQYDVPANKCKRVRSDEVVTGVCFGWDFWSGCKQGSSHLKDSKGNEIDSSGPHDMVIVRGDSIYVDNSVDASKVCKGKYV